MEGFENSDRTFDGRPTYKALISQEDLSGDEHHLYPNQEKQQGTVDKNQIIFINCINCYTVFLILVPDSNIVLETHCANFWIFLNLHPCFAQIIK